MRYNRDTLERLSKNRHYLMSDEQLNQLDEYRLHDMKIKKQSQTIPRHMTGIKREKRDDGTTDRNSMPVFGEE